MDSPSRGRSGPAGLMPRTLIALNDPAVRSISKNSACRFARPLVHGCYVIDTRHRLSGEDPSTQSSARDIESPPDAGVKGLRRPCLCCVFCFRLAVLAMLAIAVASL